MSEIKFDHDWADAMSDLKAATSAWGLAQLNAEDAKRRLKEADGRLGDAMQRINNFFKGPHP